MATITIISYSGKPFANRIDAGRIMAEKVRYLNSKDTVVLGIPRGGIIVAAEVARILGSEFDIVLTRKLGAPGQDHWLASADFGCTIHTDTHTGSDI